MVENVERYFAKNQDAFFYSEKLGKYCAKSVHYGNKERFYLANREKDKPIVSIEKIIEYVNELLETIGIKHVDYNDAIKTFEKINYDEIKNRHNLSDERDIIWMKFTESGHIGVVAISNDIGFDIPESNDEYNDKISKYNEYKKRIESVWKYTSSGILVHSVGEKWNDSFVLVFPLEKSNRKCKYDRHEIETAVGNYLEKMEVPIIDYYSHNY